ncbi:zf-HC2 domain-containing protein [Anaerotignum sp.]|uniref:zf-HC2 domain-containing protein n=1 Tax=Anaerotignum sp. TaxID=2039241 RepID=UPI002714AB6F|nr:zf-HC2 domain-containing protein [Anaerotignum sp.]
MSCNRCKGLLWQYLAGELTKEDADFVAEHLKICTSCQEEAVQLQKIMDLLKSLPDEELPQGYHEELMDKLEAEQKTIPFIVPRKPRYRWKQFSLIAAAVVLVAAIGGVQGILSLRGSQGEIRQDLTADKENGLGDDVPMDYSGMIQEKGTDVLEGELQRTESRSSDQKEVTDQEESMVSETTNKKEPKAKENAQEILLEEVSSGALRNTEEVLSEGTNQDVETQTLMDNGQEESVSQIAEGAPRSIMMLQNDEEDEASIQQQVILSVKNKEGMIDSISNLAISLGGYEVERSFEDTISVFVPSDKTEDFMDGLKDFGETRYLQDISQRTDEVRFEVALETK